MLKPLEENELKHFLRNGLAERVQLIGLQVHLTLLQWIFFVWEVPKDKVYSKKCW